MLDTALTSWSAWWQSVPPTFAFLLALPFAVAAAGLLAEGWRQSRQR
jgi:hypothetical protein